MDASAPEAEPRSTPGVIATALTAVVMLAGGFAAGAMVVGPRFAAVPAAPVVADEAAEPGHGAPPGAQIFSLDGLIVNPAGSRGQHHLIVTVAFELPTAALHAQLRAVEIPLRDAVAALLERRTLDELTAPGVRERLRTEFAALVAPYLGGGTVRVFVPQYIVQ